MSFLDCIERSLTKKKITGKKAEEVKERYRNLYDSFIKQGMTKGDAEAAAVKQAIIKADAEVTYRVRGRIKDQEIALRFNEGLRSFKGGDYGLAAQSFMEQDARASNGNYVSRREKYRGMFHAAMDEAIAKYSTKAAGLYKPVQGLENIIKELFGEDSKDASAKLIADAWTKANDMGVELWNLHGGALLKRLDWRIPQLQSAVKLAKTGQKEWVNDHLGWLDWTKVRRSDGRLIDAADRVKILNDVHNTIKTDGKWMPPDSAKGATATANMLDASRFLIYKDSAAWLGMHAKYGDGNVFEVMVHHMDDRAHHLAMLETFGRNPEAMRDMLKAQAMHLAGFADAQVTGPASTSTLPGVMEKLKTFDDMFDKATRKNTMGAENKLAHAFSGVRNVLTSAVLGSATLVAVPGDMMTSALARHYAGLPWVQGFGKYLRALNPLDTEVRSLARRAGLVDDMAATVAYASQRFSGLNTYGPAWTKKLSDVALRLSLLTPHTQAARWAHGLEWMGFMHDMKGRAFADLPFQKTLQKYGILESDWNAFRAIASWEPEAGSQFLRPADILNGKLTDAKLALHDRFMALIGGESRLAVPDATLRAAVVLKGNTRPGTVLGELAASGAMFKNFPVTVAFLYGREALAKETMVGTASYVAAFGLSMTMVGALGTQLNELAQGRDPIDMSQPGFWAKAALKGGALGAFGDFVFQDVNTYGQGPANVLAGPVADLIGSGINLTLGNVADAMHGKPTHVGAEAVNFASRIAPGSNTWWARLVMQRLFIEQIQKAVDPKASSKFQRKATKQKKEYGNSYFWPPGQTAPQRGPLLR